MADGYTQTIVKSIMSNVEPGLSKQNSLIKIVTPQNVLQIANNLIYDPI